MRRSGAAVDGGRDGGTASSAASASSASASAASASASSGARVPEAVSARRWNVRRRRRPPRPRPRWRRGATRRSLPPAAAARAPHRNPPARPTPPPPPPTPPPALLLLLLLLLLLAAARGVEVRARGPARRQVRSVPSVRSVRRRPSAVGPVDVHKTLALGGFERRPDERSIATVTRARTRTRETAAFRSTHQRDPQPSRDVGLDRARASPPRLRLLALAPPHARLLRDDPSAVSASNSPAA